MHTIDLLRGQGVPAKTTLGGVAIIAVIVAVPVLAAVAMLDRYLVNRTDIEIQQQVIAREQATIEKYAPDLKLKESLDKKRDLVHSRLSEVSSSIGEYIQWSPVLVTIVENMPGDMVMNGLSVENRREKKKVPKKNDPKRTVNVNITKRTLILDISGTRTGNYSTTVNDYSENLKNSTVLGPKLENITFAKRSGGLGEEKADSWTMRLIFKSES